MSRRFRGRDLIRYGAVVFAALAVAYGARVWDQASNDVHLTYRGAPAGVLVVEITDEDGERMRRTEFGERSERAHTVQLPRGHFVAALKVGEDRRRVDFVVEGDRSLDLAWSR